MILKLGDTITAHAEYLKVYPHPPNYREGYKYVNNEISVAWRTKVLPISLLPRDLYLGITLFAPVQALLEIYLFNLTCLVATST
jgi:hypothetical protein